MIIKNIIIRMRFEFYFYLMKNSYYAKAINILGIINTHATFEDLFPLPATDADESPSELETDSFPFCIFKRFVDFTFFGDLRKN